MAVLHGGVELNLRPTVSRQVRLGVGPPFGAHDQILHEEWCLLGCYAVWLL
jgi:hypothetical protein